MGTSSINGGIPTPSLSSHFYAENLTETMRSGGDHVPTFPPKTFTSIHHSEIIKMFTIHPDPSIREDVSS